MKNLAGDKDCDKFIEKELVRAGIEVVHGERMNREVPASIIGKLGGFTFIRGWYYWCVNGKLPLDVARELYEDPVGKEDVRVAGHCGCPPPKEWVEYIDEDGNTVVPLSQKPEKGSSFEKYLPKNIRFAKNPAKIAKPFITSYHVDTEVGLRLLADTIKKHGLA